MKPASVKSDLEKEFGRSLTEAELSLLDEAHVLGVLKGKAPKRTARDMRRTVRRK